MSTNQTLNFEENRQEVIAGLKHAWINDLPVVWLDEIVFSKTAMVRSTWTNRGIHLKTDQMDYYSGYRAAIVAVNSSRGVISYQIYNSAVNEEIFIEFLEKMSEAMGSEGFALYMDRLTVHRMLTVKAKM